MIARICCLLLLVAAVGLVVAQPPPAPLPPYAAPKYPDVLAGKAPLRMLIASRQAMLAWKGVAAVSVLNAERKAVYTAKAGDTIGIASDSAGMSWLRKDAANFREAPKVIRLESAKPISLCTKTPDAWQTYRAPIIITALPDNTYSVALELPLEEYLRDVLPAEVAPSFHPQMMRAQAVVARTYALCKLGRHADEGADVCAFDHCQVFSFTGNRSKATDDAVTATKGLILYYRDKLAEPYYSSCCGGVTDDAGYVWGPEYARDYLIGVLDAPSRKSPADLTFEQVLAVKDAYCASSKSYRWERRYTAAEVDALAAKNLPVVTGDPKVKLRHVSNLAIDERTPSGRVATLRVEGDGASILVYGDAARWLFGTGQPGPDGLWSSLFDITITRDKEKAPVSYLIRGGGRGHGIGLCQWGAEGRARAGQNFRQILHAYYPGIRLSDEKK